MMLYGHIFFTTKATTYEHAEPLQPHSEYQAYEQLTPIIINILATWNTGEFHHPHDMQRHILVP